MAFSTAALVSVSWPTFSHSHSTVAVSFLGSRNLIAMASNEVNNLTINCENDNTVRPVVNSPPSLWGGVFSTFDMDIQLSSMYTEEIKALKEEARGMLTSVGNKFSEKLILIDTIERLGLSYHFENEVQEQLTLAFNGHFKLDPKEKDDLFIIALQFRLLRQHGLDAPSSIFKRFTDNKSGEFKKSLVSTSDDDDVKGLLSLYEASYLRRKGEEILDKAFSFSKVHLESIAPNLPESPLKKQVLHALDQSLQRGFPRIEAHRYISLYGQVESKNESLLRLAKLDFNLLQMQHKEDLCQLTRWWKEMDLISRLPYVRDRVVECYFWSLGIYSEPQYSDARIMLVKAAILLTVIDDTYDAYGTIQELKVFTDAIQKWDLREIDQLPDYMKICYRALLNHFEALDADLTPKGRSYAVHYVKEAVKEIVRSYYVEAIWFNEGHLPVFDEYMRHAKITSGSYFVTVSSFLGMGSATIEVFNWILAKPKILVAGQTLVRIIDDIATYEVEKSRGQVTVGIDCYMKENGLSKQVAMEYLHKIVENAWEDLNEGLMDNSVPMEILIRGFNYARLCNVIYKGGQDGYTHPEKVVKPQIVALLVDSFEI